MSKIQEALKQALEALEIAADGGGVNFYAYAQDIREALAEQPAQPSKPWVGLTESEIEKLAVESGKATFLNDNEQTDILWFDGDCFGLARALEAKLREKNA